MTEIRFHHPAIKPLWLEAIEISTLALVSLSVLYSIGSNIYTLAASKKSGSIKLPSSSSPPVTRGEAFSRQILENIEELPENDGEYVQEARFWRKVMPMRVILLLPVLATVTLQAIHTYRTLTTSPISTWTWAMGAIISFVCVYQVILTVTYIFIKNVLRHTSVTNHLFTIAGFLFFYIYITTLGQYLVNDTDIFLTWIEYSLLGLTLIQVICVGLMPCAPERYLDLKRMYNKAVAEAISKTAKADAGEEGDNDPQSETNMNNEYSSSILSQAMLVWVAPVISKMSKIDQADIQDLPGLHTFLTTQNTAIEASRYSWTKLSIARWGITRAFLWEIWIPQWRAVVPGLAITCLLVPLWYIPHVALQHVLSAIEIGLDRRTAIAWAFVLVFGKISTGVIKLAELAYINTYASPRIRAHTQYLLFNKLLTRNTFAKSGKNDAGDTDDSKQPSPPSKADILNLISVDVSAVAELGFTFFTLIRSQMELVLGASYVWILLGPSGLWGLSTLLLTCVPAYYLSKIQYKIYERKMAISDKKISLMQEVIQAISMVKYMAAERFWFKRIKKVRDEEFKRTIQARLIGALSGFLYSSAPTIIVVVSFAHYALIAKKTLTASIAFTSIAVFEELRPCLLSLPETIAESLQQILSAKRIGAFMLTPDVDYFNEILIDADVNRIDESLYIKGTVGWSTSPQPTSAGYTSTGVETTTSAASFLLQSIDITFPLGQVTLIAGKFGSGKTLMLLAMLGECCLIEGDISYAVSEVMVPGLIKNENWDLISTGVAYVPQTPWLQSQSIRENILFGLPLNMERYRAVLFSVGLLPDLEILEDTDLTEIGERGKVLSGGQKARVSLARAVYSRAATILLDDVISAVDAQTSQHIVEHCFRGPLMTGRTVIIASHAVETLAPLADQAIFLDAGRVVWKGNGPGLMASEHMQHLKSGHQDHPQSSQAEIPSTELLEKRRGSGGPETAVKFEIKESPPKTPKQLVMDEFREKGIVDMRVWKELIKFNGGKFFRLGTIVLLFSSSLMPVFERRVLELWTHQNSYPQESDPSIVFWVALYAAISGANIVLDAIFNLWRFFGGIRATRRVHSEMLERMLRAKMLFFSKTRAGSIVQRFGKDLTNTLSCSQMIGEIASSVISIVLAMISVTYYGGWLFAGITLSIFVILYKPSVWYRSAGRQIRRLESVTPGLINAIYGETIAGTAVIRAFGVQSVFVSELTRTLNSSINISAWRSYLGRWLWINLALVDVIIVSTVLCFIVDSDDISAASAGFILAFAGTISGNVNWLLIYVRNFELAGVSLERTAEYRRLEGEGGNELINCLDRADDDAIESRMAAEYGNWPSTGQLEVDELSAKYGPDMPEILHKISFSVEGGERVGIVGATGGGKSTLAKALFSFVDISHGRIMIDGRDTANIPLGQVRSKLGIIAQDPILLSGSLRLNLDIEGKYTDEQLYDALHQVQLIRKSTKSIKSSSSSSSSSSSDLSTAISRTSAAGDERSSLLPIVPNSPMSSTATAVGEPEDNTNMFSNLDYEIKTGGENLSAGQKQLVVLARALLKKHKILILDEATASIDSATDAEISRVVHEEFTGATVLIIAHRLRTIMPCSKILVMDKGHLVQQGSPIQLIRQAGRFQELCRAAGGEEYRQLLALAEREAKKGQLVDIDV